MEKIIFLLKTWDDLLNVSIMFRLPKQDTGSVMKPLPIK